MRIVLSLFMLVVSSQLFANIQIESTIKEVMVYRQNANLVNMANTQLPAGNSEIVIKGISTSINPKSLQVSLSATGKVSLLSATYATNYLADKKLTEEQQGWKDRLDELNEEIQWTRSQKQIYVDLITVLNENKKIAGEDVGMDPNKLANLLVLYKEKQFDYNRQKLALAKEEKELNEEINKVQQQLNAVNAKVNQPTGTLILQVNALSPSKASFKCSYVVNNAGWSPIYDLRSEGTDQPVELVYKAHVYQNSGLDWKQVDLKISTGNPTMNNNRPILSPLYVDFYQTYATQTVNQRAGDYKAAEMNMAAYDIELDEVSAYGDKYDDGFQYNNQLAVNQLTAEYEILLPQSIPSDGKQHLVGLDSYDLPSTYKYHTVPKLDCSAFLLAKVSDWGQYNLLSGPANIFFEGAYVGESYIDANMSNDTLLLSMGRDDGIKVKRTEMQNYSEKKFVGGNKKETIAYEIEIRNNKPFAITVEVLDQIPVSRQKEIQVELEESSGAQYDKEIGRLLWDVSLAPNQTKKITFVYTVKYPKDRTISGKK